MCLERIRKTYGRSIKHWCITELGEDKDRIHIHGIVWGIGSDQKFKEKWKYGIVWVGKYVSSRTINYITKYMLKVDEKHKEFQFKDISTPDLKRIMQGINQRATDRAQTKIFTP